MVNCLWDTSAVMAFLLAEPGARDLWAYKANAAVAFITLTELYYLLWQQENKTKADTVISTIRNWGWPILWPTEQTVLSAGKLKAIYRLGIADSFIAALAMEHKLQLVTKDPDFKPLKMEGLQTVLG